MWFYHYISLGKLRNKIYPWWAFQVNDPKKRNVRHRVTRQLICKYCTKNVLNEIKTIVFLKVFSFDSMSPGKNILPLFEPFAFPAAGDWALNINAKTIINVELNITALGDNLTRSSRAATRCINIQNSFWSSEMGRTTWSLPPNAT